MLIYCQDGESFCKCDPETSDTFYRNVHQAKTVVIKRKTVRASSMFMH